MNKTKDLKCKHYKGDGYYYDIVGGTIWLCNRCEKKLRAGILNQVKDEEDVKRLGELPVRCKILKVEKKK